MAVTITNVVERATLFVADIEATADADVLATVPHGLQQAPEDVTILELQIEAYTSQWFVSSITGTNIVLTKQNAVGSGVADPQLRVIARLGFEYEAEAPTPERVPSPVGGIE